MMSKGYPYKEMYQLDGQEWVKEDDWLTKVRYANPLLLLQDILRRKVSEIVSSAYKGLDQLPNPKTTKQELKGYFSQLPATVRDSLLQDLLSFKCGRDPLVEEKYPRMLFYSEIMCSTAISKLCLERISTLEESNLNSLLKILSEEGNNLQTFRLHKCWPRGNMIADDLLAMIFRSATKLTTLGLAGFCTVSILKIVGENCKCLRRLDLSNSTVSHKGLTYLTQNIVKVDAGHDKSEDWESSVWKLPNIFLPLRKLIPDGESEECYKRQKSQLCDTLSVLQLSVGPLGKDTSRGVLMVLELAQNLEHLTGPDMNDLFQLLRSELIKNKIEINQLPTLNLPSIFTSVVDETTLRLVGRLFPELRVLKSSKFPRGYNTSVPITMLNCFSSLDTLKSTNTPYVDSDISKLAPQIRERLTVLELGNGHAQNSFRLQVISQLPRLTDLKLHYDSFIWGSEQAVLLWNLRNVILSGRVTQKCFFKVLEFAPNLEKLSVGIILYRTLDFVQRLCSITESPMLKVLEITEGYFLHTKDDLAYFLTFFTNMTRIRGIPRKLM